MSAPIALEAVHVLPKYPQYFACTIGNVFSAEECDDLIKMTETRGYEQALVNTGFGQQTLMTDFRNNDRCIVDDEVQADKIYQRILPFVPQQYKDNYGGLWEAVSLNERLRFLRYGPEQEFKPHYDGNYVRPDGPKKGEVSFYTVQLYLNDVEKGGETSFFIPNKHNHDEDIIPVDPQKGMAIIFQHNILHSGSPVISGKKYVIRTDVMYKKVK